MPEPDRIIRLRTVLARTGLSRSTMYRKIAEGTFPAQIKISINGAGWRESDINRWVADPVSWHTSGLQKTATSDGRAIRCSHC
ncbi:AlpA family phage regulatory protein [Mesorhizobium sp. ESP-6-4]|uniref:helix-turn-helix transcriptional regulator n=1 Tax=Mesorhizobium sp. ESP-6-4 TaxID=2876624 RepID=UPI001CCDD9AC|nr:AlpA family phage regulatory protein [Mesorhizobium sp. ESP-6-4]MBZ9662505.1 AlpA family phage regulatory protein [Mesorhizobium sp. ESP-6-4]